MTHSLTNEANGLNLPGVEKRYHSVTHALLLMIPSHALNTELHSHSFRLLYYYTIPGSEYQTQDLILPV